MHHREVWSSSMCTDKINNNRECDVLKLREKKKKVVPGGDGNLGQAVEQHSGGQADKRHHGAV